MSKRRHSSQHRRETRRPKRMGWWLGLGLVVLIGAAFLWLRPKSALPSEIQVAQAHEMYQKGALFLDVRTQQEWDQGHVARSVLIPLDDLQGRLSELPRNRDIVVICMSGARSREGTTLLRENGFTRVTCMNGGIKAWVAAGFPLER